MIVQVLSSTIRAPKAKIKTMDLKRKTWWSGAHCTTPRRDQDLAGKLNATVYADRFDT